MNVDSITKKNIKLYNSFSKCFKLPTWDDTMCHSIVSQKHNREVSWKDIAKEFSITAKQLPIVQYMYNKIEFGVVGWSVSYKDILPTHRNKARLVNALVNKQVLKVIYDRVIFNPAINIARNGWSQFSLGCMLVQWQNEILLEPLVPSQHDSKSMGAGCTYAIAQTDATPYTSIPYKVKGTIQGAI